MQLKLVVASSILLSIRLSYSEAFTGVRPQVIAAAARSSASSASQTNSNIVSLQAVANPNNNDNERSTRQQLSRRDALLRFAAATATVFVSGSNIAVAADEAAVGVAAPAAIIEPPSTSSTVADLDTIVVAKGDDLPKEEVKLKVELEKSPPKPKQAEHFDDSKLVAKMEPEVKQAMVAKKEVELKVIAPDKDAKEENPIKNETTLFAKMTDDESGSTLLLPGGKTPVKVATASVASQASYSVPTSYSTSIAALNQNIKPIDSNVLLLGSALTAVVVLAGYSNNEDSEEITKLPTGTQPANVPYGLANGRNYGTAPPTPPAGATPQPAASPPVVVEEDEEMKAALIEWKKKQPTPYGIQNQGKNPFIKEMLEYCEGGKVTEKCTETITEYLDDIASTAAVAKDGDVNVLVGYLDSLVTSSSPRESTGAAVVGYLDALSVGTAPPPKSAAAVKTYLDTISASSSSARPAPFSKQVKARSTPIAASPIASVAAKPAPVAAVPTPDLSRFDSRLKQVETQGANASYQIKQYDSRLTKIETRVTSLEAKVDAIPDQVFNKMEAWQSKADVRLSEEVKKIIDVLSPETQQPPSPPPAAPVLPSPVPPPPAPVVSATVAPVAAAVSPNPMMKSTPASAPKKGYGKSSGGWKK